MKEEKRKHAALEYGVEPGQSTSIKFFTFSILYAVAAFAGIFVGDEFVRMRTGYYPDIGWRQLSLIGMGLHLCLVGIIYAVYLRKKKLSIRFAFNACAWGASSLVFQIATPYFIAWTFL